MVSLSFCDWSMRPPISSSKDQRNGSWLATTLPHTSAAQAWPEPGMQALVVEVIECVDVGDRALERAKGRSG